MAKVEIVKLGHALVEGTRGANGGAPSKDSLFGVALIQGNLVTFGGRRGAVTFRFKTERKVDMDKVLAKFEKKTVKAQGGFAYADITENRTEVVGETFDADLARMFYKAMANKKLNTRSTQKPAKTPKAEAVAA